MSDEDIIEAAAQWHARQDAEDMDWLGFTAWLEADARHRDAFDSIALLDADIDANRDTLVRLLPAEAASATVASGYSRQRRRWIGGGLTAAAAAAAAVVVVVGWGPAPRRAFTYEAGAVARDVDVAGARIALAPHSSVTATEDGEGGITLVGRAAFSVRHDPSRTLVVHSQGYDIRDVGTRFEVVASEGIVNVTVEEGEVALVATGHPKPPARITGGHAAIGYVGGRIEVTRARPAPLASWRTGPLVYDRIPLALVVADIGRLTGRKIAVDKDIADRPFSGVVAVGDGGRMAETLAMLAALQVRKQGDTIQLVARARR